MTTCNLNFTKESNPIAYGVFQDLQNDGVTCDELDYGYAVANTGGGQCTSAEDRTCRRNKKGVIEAAEVLEFAFDNHEKYRTIIEGRLGQPLPWYLDDFNPSTTFDAEIRKKIDDVITELKRIINSKGIKEGTDEYRSMLAAGLTWFMATPPLDDEGKLPTFGPVTTTLFDTGIKADGLDEFWTYLKNHGGLRTEGGEKVEYTALESLRLREGACSEDASVLYAAMKIAGLDPVFIRENLVGDVFSDPRLQEKMRKETRGNEHVCIGVKLNGRLRLFDAAFSTSNAQYKNFIPLTPRQFMATTLTNKAFELEEKKNFDPMIESCKIALNLDENLEFGRFCIAQHAKETGNAKLALELLTEVTRANPNLAKAYYQIGKLKKAAGDTIAAMASFDKVIELDPSVYEAYYERALLFSAAGKLELAVAEYTKLLDYEPKQSGALNNRGHLLTKLGRFDEAIADLTASIQINPKSNDAYSNRGLAHLQKGEFEKALADFRSASELKPNNPSYLLGQVLAYTALRKFEHAIEGCMRILEIDPKLVDALLIRSSLYIEIGEFTKSIDDLNSALKIDPTLKPLLFRRIIIKAMAGFGNDAASDIAAMIESQKGGIRQVTAELMNEWRNTWTTGSKKEIAAAFEAETNLNPAIFQTQIMIAYTLWLSGSKDEALERLELVEGAIIFNKKPSPSSKKIIADMLAIAPKDMSKNAKAAKILKAIRAKIK